LIEENQFSNEELEEIYKTVNGFVVEHYEVKKPAIERLFDMKTRAWVRKPEPRTVDEMMVILRRSKNVSVSFRFWLPASEGAHSCHPVSIIADRPFVHAMDWCAEKLTRCGSIGKAFVCEPMYSEDFDLLV
jgi:hypothetical protein